jgi:hypothetical protein
MFFLAREQEVDGAYSQRLNLFTEIVKKEKSKEGMRLEGGKRGKDLDWSPWKHMKEYIWYMLQV